AGGGDAAAGGGDAAAGGGDAAAGGGDAAAGGGDAAAGGGDAAAGGGDAAAGGGDAAAGGGDAATGGNGSGGDTNTCTVDLDSVACADNTDTDSVGNQPVEQGKGKDELAETGAAETMFLLIGAATMIAGGIGFRILPRLVNGRTVA
ncbi:LPXTG cell wall anchor domain-containing protein, partial [Streptomyces sp900116325]|uniref:LPXTG cell wall anchor domain-containing protein n=1 Tax=Streptomyces sp. 900116325 TaxID=3154295 RepID=UPI0033AFA8E3